MGGVVWRLIPNSFVCASGIDGTVKGLHAYSSTKRTVIVPVDSL